jgi:transposase
VRSLVVQDTELYRHLLGLVPPWSVARVELDVSGQQVDVWVEHVPATRWQCPTCARELGTYDHAPERVWRHLDSCQFATQLHARAPRVQCPEHGVHQVKLPWAEDRSRFTMMFERFAIDVLLQTDISGAMRVLRISWDETWHILKRAVERGQLVKKRQPPSVVGVDETAAARGQKYITVVCDLEQGTVEHISEHRRAESLDSYYASLTVEELASIKAVAMDMHDPYIKATRERVPDWHSKIVFDRFHVMQQLTMAVDKVRKQENRELVTEGNHSLIGSKYVWLYSRENLPARYEDRFDELRALNLRTARAWAIKESLRELWKYKSLPWAKKLWKRWYEWASRSQLKPIVYAAATLQRHIGGILSFFSHRITNAMTEGLNGKIQRIKRAAHGYRNLENFKTAIFFHCGGLDLYPRTHTKA